MAKKKITFRLGELFCGPGGLAYGAKCSKVASANGTEFSISHAWATDYDPFACNTYAHNICNDNKKTVICADIRTLELDQLISLSKIDAFAFGFPCNDFSMVGEQKGVHGTFGPLYQYGVEILKKCQPKWFLAENVGGLQSSNEGKTFSRILRAFFDAGYSVYPHYYSFDKYGVPQARQRIIIVGIRADLNLPFHIPSPKPYEKVDVSARTALECPPILFDAFNNETTKQSDTVVARLKHIKPGENAFTAQIPEHLQLRINGAKISQIYKRLNPERPAYTVTGSGGGGTHMYHWSENRALTNRERARLQTFPDSYEFLGSKEDVRKQIGMAVPCKGAQVVFEAILKTFAGIDYPCVSSKFPALRHVQEVKTNIDYSEDMRKLEQAILFYERGMRYET